MTQAIFSLVFQYGLFEILGVHFDAELTMLINIETPTRILASCIERVVPPSNFGSLDQFVYLLGACDNVNEVYSAQFLPKQGLRLLGSKCAVLNNIYVSVSVM